MENSNQYWCGRFKIVLSFIDVIGCSFHYRLRRHPIWQDIRLNVCISTTKNNTTQSSKKYWVKITKLWVKCGHNETSIRTSKNAVILLYFFFHFKALWDWNSVVYMFIFKVFGRELMRLDITCFNTWSGKALQQKLVKYRYSSSFLHLYILYGTKLTMVTYFSQHWYGGVTGLQTNFLFSFLHRRQSSWSRSTAALLSLFRSQFPHDVELQGS